jgi:hypothetical protein
MAGKYEAFRKLYPKAPIESSAFDRINIVLDAPAFPNDPSNKMRVRDLDTTQLCDLYVRLRKELAEKEVQVSVLETQKAALTYLFTNRFEEVDVTSMKFANGVTLGESVEPLPNVKDSTALKSWIKETGQEDLLTLNYQTLASITKQALLEGKPIPPGVEVFMKQKLTARGLNQKGDTNND